ncbi:MAG: SGNH/GDSL hydrolase family protein [Deltaproteobacteria bacterium]|nr:SGNH/GDSL hydrolase family protein [Deltaproteobacteria bacterium]
MAEVRVYMKNGKRVLLITDSMAMPRPEAKYEETWIYLLKQAFPDYDFLDKSDRGSTSLRLVTEGGGGVDLLEMYEPDLVVLQLGMAECAPRLFKKTGFEFFFLNRILPRRFRLDYVNFIKKRRGRNPKITDVSPDGFRNNLMNYFERARKMNVKVIVFLISRATKLFQGKSPHITENVTLYNDIYREVAARFPNVHLVVPFDEDVDLEELAIDETHVDARGHQILFNKLKPFLV